MKQLEFLKKLNKIKKPYYTLADLQIILGKKRAVTKVMVSRFVKRGVLKKIGRNVYVPALTEYNIEEIAADLYPPCYLSFETVLSKYGILSQLPYTLTFATSRRSKKIILDGREVEYRKLKKELFFGYKFVGKLPLAEPEKALLDQVYMVSLGLASLDFKELTLREISKKQLLNFSKKFPKRVQKMLSLL